VWPPDCFGARGMERPCPVVIGAIVIAASVCSCGKADSSFGTTGNATGPEVFTPSQVAAARAQCGQPEGPDAPAPASASEAETLVVGSWLACKLGGDSPPAVSNALVSSRQYNADGTWVNLGLDAQGGLVRVFGAENQGTWSAGSLAPQDTQPQPTDTRLNVHFSNGSGNGGTAVFETDPTRLVWNPDYFEEWLVRIAP
jgi:hypothetical protein